MKKVIALLLIATLSLSLCGCFPFNLFNTSKAESDLESIADKISSDLDDSSSKLESSIGNLVSGIDDSSDTQIIGNDDFGYMKIPKDFVKFTDVSGSDDLQYSDKAGSTIFTMNKISADVPAYTAMENIADTVKERGATNVETGSSAEINGFVGDEITCYYPDEQKYLNVYLIPFTEKTVYLAVEYTKGNEDMLDYLQTWQSTEFY